MELLLGGALLHGFPFLAAKLSSHRQSTPLTLGLDAARIGRRTNRLWSDLRWRWCATTAACKRHNEA
jgi:hypothetical protein